MKLLILAPLFAVYSLNLTACNTMKQEPVKMTIQHFGIMEGASLWHSFSPDETEFEQRFDETDGAILMDKTSKQPFTGIIEVYNANQILNRYSDRQLVAEYCYENGIINGWQKIYESNGKIMTERLIEKYDSKPAVIKSRFYRNGNLCEEKELITTNETSCYQTTRYDENGRKESTAKTPFHLGEINNRGDDIHSYIEIYNWHKEHAPIK
jgi:antitoxin component YwqK of YwqJK toxin-antitoxin module